MSICELEILIFARHFSVSEMGGQGNQQHMFNSRQPPKKKRKSRTAFTNHQIFELEKRFLYQKYLSPADRDDIAQQLGLTNAQVRHNMPTLQHLFPVHIYSCLYGYCYFYLAFDIAANYDDALDIYFSLSFIKWFIFERSVRNATEDSIRLNIIIEQEHIDYRWGNKSVSLHVVTFATTRLKRKRKSPMERFLTSRIIILRAY